MKIRCLAVSMAAMMLVGCAGLKSVWQQMTPTQKAKYAINIAVVASEEIIKSARLFISDEEDLDKIQAKIAEVAASLQSSINIILALIPPGNENVEAYAAEAIAKLEAEAATLGE